jgi:hypothetical protein
LVGVTLKAVALQIVAVVLAIAAFGFTVTVIVNVAPVHTPERGVTVYVAVAGALVELASVWLMLACPMAWALLPEIEPAGAMTGAAHV